MHPGPEYPRDAVSQADVGHAPTNSGLSGHDAGVSARATFVTKLGMRLLVMGAPVFLAGRSSRRKSPAGGGEPGNPIDNDGFECPKLAAGRFLFHAGSGSSPQNIRLALPRYFPDVLPNVFYSCVFRICFRMPYLALFLDLAYQCLLLRCFLLCFHILHSEFAFLTCVQLSKFAALLGFPSLCSAVLPCTTLIYACS